MSTPTPTRYGEWRNVNGHLIDESASGDNSDFLEQPDSEEAIETAPVDDVTAEDDPEPVLED